MSTLSPPCDPPTRAPDAHKGNFGRVLLCGGSRGMAGSISLSSIAALYTGSGLVSAAVPDRCLETVAGFHPCLMTIPLADDPQGRFAAGAFKRLASIIESFDAIGCGPGMTTHAGSMQIVRMLLGRSALPRVFDADAINCLAKMGWANQKTAVSGSLVLTPHPGELMRLASSDMTVRNRADRDQQIESAKRLASDHGVTIVVKGGPTLVVDADHTWTNQTGNPGMATAGTGDVLTGMITSLLGQGLSAWDAARLGVWLHGAAGDLAAGIRSQAGMTALELLDAIPQLLARPLRKKA